MERKEVGMSMDQNGMKYEDQREQKNQIRKKVYMPFLQQRSAFLASISLKIAFNHVMFSKEGLERQTS